MKCAGGVEVQFDKPCPKCGVDRKGPCAEAMRQASEAIDDMIAALKIARSWMPEKAIEPSGVAMRDIAIVEAAIAKGEALS